MFPDLHSSSLISLGQLCDDDCHIHLDKHKIIVRKNHNVIFTGKRNFTDGLWDINLSTPSLNQQMNVIIRNNITATLLIDYYYACLFSPIKQTFLRAINNGNFISWPGITAKSVTNFMTKSVATAKGHLDQEKQKLQSTSTKQADEVDDAFPSKISNATHQLCSAIVDYTAKDTAYADLTGRFPKISSRGNQYLLVVYDYDSNAIVAEPLKSKQAGEIKRAWIELNNIFRNRGV